MLSPRVKGPLPQAAHPVPLFASRALLVLWPAFVMAGVLEMLVFAVVDPGTLHGFGAERVGGSRGAIYSATFLVFWAAVALAGAITQWLQAPGPGTGR